MADSKYSLKLVATIIFALTFFASQAFAVNHPPILSKISSKEVLFGKSLSMLITATDPDGNKITYSSPNLPDGAALDPVTGSFLWTPSIKQIGTYQLTFVASDDGTPSLSSSETIPVEVVFETTISQKVFGLGVGQGVAVIRTSKPSDLYPKFNKIEIDDQPYTPDQPVVITTDSAKIKAEISSPFNITKNTVAFLVDGKAADFLSFSNIKPFGDQYSILSLSVETVLRNLSPGDHAISLVAGNELGFTTQKLTLTVATARLVGIPLVFPSPYNPSSGGSLTIQYSLSQDADVDIYIFGSSIAIIKKIAVYKGLEGGRMGANKVVWDGRTDFGTVVSNGIYVGTIVDRNSEAVLGKMKIVIY